MKDSIRKGNKVVLTAAHWGLVTGDIALVTEEMDQIHVLITAPGLPAGGLKVPSSDLRRAKKEDFAK